MNMNMTEEGSIFLVIPTLKQGGAERVISELANYFSSQNVDVHLILLVAADDFYPINPNVHIHRLGFVNKGKLRRHFAEMQVLVKFRSLLKLYKPKSVLSFMDKYNIFTILASRFLNLRVFVSDRSNPNLHRSFFSQFLKSLTYKHATGIIAQTLLAKESLENLTGNENIRVIPNPVKEVQLYPDEAREKFIINVGRLVPEKGQGLLIRAFANLQAEDWKLIILGDGPLRSELESLVLYLGLENKVRMPGAVSDIDKWLAKSKIFAFSSISEGFPNALMEAMAAGLPCVSFDCDAGPSEIIVNGLNGLLVSPNNVGEFTSRLSFLINMPEEAERISLNALDIRQQYNINVIGDRYFEFLLNG